MPISRVRQKKLFASLFRSPECWELFQPSKRLYLARGHLTPSKDLLFRDW